ncbi:PAS domain-containing protein [Gracilimonas sp.]|uniref:PAS domain-containing protein n=1 Tax=Gracilimonas sp. TaxID=1974203 RepID=UPI00287280C9|nr:PAS domain-containing protein [Gracilimonas sp.]
MGSLTDITERKKYEEKLRESLERYDFVSKATRDAIYDWDIENNNLHWGEGFKKLFGHEPGEGTYTIEKYHQSVHPEDREEAFDDLKFTLQDSSMNKWAYEYRFKRDDGSYAHVIENGYIVRNDDGAPIRMI